MIINRLDNVDINLADGHKYALRDIKAGENIIKYGNPIGHATEDIKAGEHVEAMNRVILEIETLGRCTPMYISVPLLG